MNTVKYFLGVRFDDNGENPQAFCQNLVVYEDGSRRELPAVSISQAEKEWDDYIELWSLSSLRDRDNALAEVARLKNVVAEVGNENNTLQARIAELEAQLDALLNPPGPDLATIDGAKAYIAAERYKVETGGINVGELRITTNRDEMGVWLGMMLTVVLKPGLKSSFEYKHRGGNKNVQLTPEQVLRGFECFAWFVDECFAAERKLQELLDAGTPIDEVLTLLPECWPQTQFEWIAPI